MGAFTAEWTFVNYIMIIVVESVESCNLKIYHLVTERTCVADGFRLRFQRHSRQQAQQQRRSQQYGKTPLHLRGLLKVKCSGLFYRHSAAGNRGALHDGSSRIGKIRHERPPPPPARIRRWRRQPCRCGFCSPSMYTNTIARENAGRNKNVRAFGNFFAENFFEYPPAPPGRFGFLRPRPWRTAAPVPPFSAASGKDEK